MKEVKRWSVISTRKGDHFMQESEAGEFVQSSNYDALAANYARLRKWAEREIAEAYDAGWRAIGWKYGDGTMYARASIQEFDKMEAGK